MNLRLIDIIDAIDGICNMVFFSYFILLPLLYFSEDRVIDWGTTQSKVFYAVWLIALLWVAFIPSLETLKSLLSH